MEAPLILEDQKQIVEWAKDLLERHSNTSILIEVLVGNEKKSDFFGENLDEIRKLYKNKNSAWRTQVINAILQQQYRLENDIKEGQIVSDGELVGFADDIDYESRTFDLYSNKECHIDSFIDTFEIDSFKRV